MFIADETLRSHFPAFGASHRGTYRLAYQNHKAMPKAVIGIAFTSCEACPVRRRRTATKAAKPRTTFGIRATFWDEGPKRLRADS